MTEDLEQDPPHDRRRLVRRGDLFVQQVIFDGAWQDVNLFHPQPAPAVNLELGNGYSHTHPAAHFRPHLLVARATADGRLTLFNREFTVRQRDRRSEQHTLASPDELLAVLAEHFGPTLPPGTRFDPPGPP